MKNTLIRVLAATILFGGMLAARAADDDDDNKPSFKSGPQPGTKTKPVHLPSSFQVWMVTGPRAARYHSFVCAQGLNPACFIFVKEFDPEDKTLVALLKKLDELMAKHPDARFGTCLVVLNDGGFRDALEKEDDDFSKRLAETASVKDELEAKMKEMAKTEKLEHVTLALDTKAGPKALNLNEEAGITVLFYNRHIVENSYAFKEKMKEEDVTRIAGEIEKVVLEVERLSRPVYRKKVIKTK